MSEWKVGDKALCVNNGLLPYQTGDSVGKLPELRLNCRYVVNDIRTCSCGSVSLDVGLIQTSGGGIRCSCGIVSPNSDIHWCNASRFVKEVNDEKENENVEEQIKEAVASGNMELVDELLDKLNK